MDPTLRQLRYLIALDDERHFGRAAQSVNVSQPALSVQVRQLESRLGVQLFERGGREVAPTSAGREVLLRARRIVREIQQLREAARWRTGLSGRLRIGVIPTVAPYLLPGALPLLRGKNLNLDLGVREAQTHVLVEELSSGQLDAIIVAVPCSVDDVVEQELFRDHFVLAGSPQTIADLDINVHPDKLDPQLLLLLDDGHCLADQALAACAMSRSQTRTDLAASSLSTLCRLAGEGFGLTLVPEIALKSETAAARKLALRRFVEPEPVRRICLLRRKVSVDDGWFTELAELLSRAAFLELDSARAILPSNSIEIGRDKSTGARYKGAPKESTNE